jgi:trimeric autotransporter adhesin
MLTRTNATLLALAILWSADPILAQTLLFAGTRENVNPLTPPGGRCVPPYFNTVTIAPGALSSTGTSNISNFASTQSHCIVSAPPTQIAEGVFEYRFEAGDTIIGTYTGEVSGTGTPGTFNSVENLTITGGTGRFVNATGTITADGVLHLSSGYGNYSGTLEGSITATETTASGQFATAYGSPSAATGEFATAYGAFSYAAGDRSLAVGSFAEASNTGSVALGDNTFASGMASLAVGQNATATAAAATAVGHNSVGSGIGSFAGGVRAQATGIGAVSVGQLSQATAANSTAVGARAWSSLAGSTAIGADAVTTAANQVSLGGTGSSVRVGDIAASTAAQTGTVSVATVDDSGTLGRNTTLIPAVTALQTAAMAQAGQISAMEAAQASLANSVDSLFDLRQLDRRDMRKGIAAAVAMGHASMPSATGRTSYVLNAATFRGEYAIGGSIMHRLSADFGVGAGFSFGGRKNSAVRVGIAGEM